MRILITGICGFIGKAITHGLRENCEKVEIVGIDNLLRAGSELNRRHLKKLGIRFFHADIRNASDLDELPICDVVIDAAANPSVVAGVNGLASSRQVIEHNLVGTFNILELCRRWSSKLILLSTSRVYSIKALTSIAMKVKDHAFIPVAQKDSGSGISAAGIGESFSTEPPLSLYGTSKRASELLAVEYSEAFDFPLYINRCGVLAGSGQFGKADQGIFSYWIHAYCHQEPLKFIGFRGSGHQVRDCLHPDDLTRLIQKQLKDPSSKKRSALNISGGIENSISLYQLNQWCVQRFGKRKVDKNKQDRAFDIPWLVLDNRKAKKIWNWQPTKDLNLILEEIALHAEQNPNWLQYTSD
jgi:CDP-paratose 2-epimerase